MKLDLYSRFPGSREAEQERKLVEVLVGEVRFGIDIMSVSEVVAPRPVIPVPGAPAHVIGVADHRDRVVPVIDLRRRLGLKGDRGPRSKWMIVRTEGGDTALLIDHVAGVIDVHRRDRREHHPLVFGDGSDWIRDVYGHGQGLVFELDLAAVTGGARESLEQGATSEEEP